MTDVEKKNAFILKGLLKTTVMEKFKPEQELIRKVTERNDFSDHKKDVTVFLNSVNEDTERYLITERSKTSVNQMAGLHDENRKYAWMQNLKLPQRPISPHPNSRINRVHVTQILASTAREMKSGEGSSMEGFYDDDESSDVASLRDDLQFENLIPKDVRKDYQSFSYEY